MKKSVKSGNSRISEKTYKSGYTNMTHPEEKRDAKEYLDGLILENAELVI